MVKAKVTIRDVAAEANVSIASVSLFLNDKPGLADATRRRIEEAIQKLEYVPLRRKSISSEMSQSLVGLVVEKLPVSTFSDMFYGEVIQGMEHCARDYGYSITLKVLGNNNTVLHSDEQHNHIEGYIVLGGGDITGDIINQLVEHKLPVILVDNQLVDAKIDCVIADNLTGTYQAVQYLLSQGYRNIAFIQGPTKYRSLVERFQGYCCALFDAGIPLNPSLIQPSISSGMPNKGYREMKALLEAGNRFDAVLCVSDRSAFGALQALQEAGLRVPHDVAVMGFDNVAQSGHTSPPLTTIDVPKRTMGEIAIRRLHSRILGESIEMPTKSVVYTSLVVRDST